MDEQIDIFDDFYFGDNGDDVEETVVVAEGVGSSSPVPSWARQEASEIEAGVWVESDAVAGSTGYCSPSPTDLHRILDNTEWFIIIPDII